MDENLEKELKRFNNLPDIRKLEELVSISEQEISENTLNFLFQVFEREKYEKIRIKVIFILKNIKKKEIAQKLMEYYAYERENSVRLVLTEMIGDMTSAKTNDFLSKISTADENDVIRSMAIRKLHESGKLKKEKLRELLLEIIQNDKATFPKQLSLKIFPEYADSESLQKLKLVYGKETKTKMKQLIFQTMSKIAENLNEDLGIKKPLFEDVQEDLEKIHKKKRRRRRLKKKSNDEENLFF